MPTPYRPLPPTLTPSSIPHRSLSYQQASDALKQQLAADIRKADRHTWLVFCYVDGRRSIGEIAKFLPGDLPPSQRVLKVEAALLRLMDAHLLARKTGQSYQPPPTSPWPAAQRRAQSQPAPVPKQQRRPFLPVLLAALVAGWQRSQQVARQLWAARVPIGRALHRLWIASHNLVRGPVIRARLFTGEAVVPPRPAPSSHPRPAQPLATRVRLQPVPPSGWKRISGRLKAIGKRSA